MKILFRVLCMFICLCLSVWLVATPVLAAKLRCSNIEVGTFFRKADASDVMRCMASSARHDYGGGSTQLHIAASVSSKAWGHKSFAEAWGRCEHEE